MIVGLRGWLYAGCKSLNQCAVLRNTTSSFQENPMCCRRKQEVLWSTNEETCLLRPYSVKYLAMEDTLNVSAASAFRVEP